MQKFLCQNYLAILKSELVVALGCTEPIAIAYAAAKARQLLGTIPERGTVHCSGNIVKNVMGVTVPNSGRTARHRRFRHSWHRRRRPRRELAVLEGVTDADREQTRALLAQGFCTCELIQNVATLYIVVEVWGGGHSALVEIQNTHENITRMEKDGESVLPKREISEEELRAEGGPVPSDGAGYP